AQRRAELVAHVRQEPALELGNLPELLGLLVQFGVKRQHALVGLVQFGAQGRVLGAQAPKLGFDVGGTGHVRPPRRTARALVSSRPRSKSRSSTASTSAGWRKARPSYCARLQRDCRPSLCMSSSAPGVAGTTKAGARRHWLPTVPGCEARPRPGTPGSWIAAAMLPTPAKRTTPAPGSWMNAAAAPPRVEDMRACMRATTSSTARPAASAAAAIPASAASAASRPWPRPSTSAPDTRSPSEPRYQVSPHTVSWLIGTRSAP